MEKLRELALWIILELGLVLALSWLGNSYCYVFENIRYIGAITDKKVEGNTLTFVVTPKDSKNFLKTSVTVGKGEYEKFHVGDSVTISNIGLEKISNDDNEYKDSFTMTIAITAVAAILVLLRIMYLIYTKD